MVAEVQSSGGHGLFHDDGSPALLARPSSLSAAAPKQSLTIAFILFSYFSKVKGLDENTLGMINGTWRRGIRVECETASSSEVLCKVTATWTDRGW